jgi:excisionase family DNA binding protein
MTREYCPTCHRLAPEKALRTSEVAAVLGCSIDMLKKYIAGGLLTCWRVGHDRRFEPSEVRRFMKELGVPQERLGGAT